MNASDPASSNELTDEQLDALLDHTGRELLQHIQASTDPTVTLTQLMATWPDAPDSKNTLTQAELLGWPNRFADRRHPGSHRRSWRIIRTAAALAAGATFVAVALSIAGGHRVDPSYRHKLLPLSSCSRCWINKRTLVFIPFDPSKAALNKSAYPQLNIVLQKIKLNRASLDHILVGGFGTDPHATARENHLFLQRTRTIRDWLTSHNVPASMLSVWGNGGQHRGITVTIFFHFSATERTSRPHSGGA